METRAAKKQTTKEKLLSCAWTLDTLVGNAHVCIFIVVYIV